MSLRDHIAALRGRRPAASVRTEAEDDPEAPDDEDIEDEEDDDMADKPDAKPAAGNDPKPDAKPADTPAQAAAPADVDAACRAADLAELAAPLIVAGATMEAVRARIEDAGQVRQVVAAAGRFDARFKPAFDRLGAVAIKAGLSADAAGEVATELAAALQAPAIRSAISPDATATEAARAGWDKAVAKVNGRKAKAA